MLIASSSAIVGVMNSQAIARSDIPPSRNVRVDVADAMGSGFASVISTLAATTDSSVHAPQRSAGVCTGLSQ